MPIAKAWRRELEEKEGWGPAMARLTEKQRAYVMAQVSDPLGNPTRWAKAAGYSDLSEGAKVTAFKLERMPAIGAAVEEVARQHLSVRGPLLGISVIMKIARDDKHPKQLAAAIALADRTGFHAASEHKVVVEDRRDPVAMLARVKELAGVLGIDPVKLLGGDVSRETFSDAMKVIEHREVLGDGDGLPEGGQRDGDRPGDSDGT